MVALLGTAYAEGVCAMVLCRREDDGTYVVLMQSIDHPLVPRTDPPFYQWTSPIRAEVGASLCMHFSALKAAVQGNVFVISCMLVTD